MSQVENVKETSAQRVCVKLSVLTIIIISLVTVQNRKRNKSSGKNRWKNKTKQKIGKLLETGISMIGTAFLVQYSIHWAAGKFAIKGEQILRSYVTSVSIARNKSLNIPWKTECWKPLWKSLLFELIINIQI